MSSHPIDKFIIFLNEYRQAQRSGRNYRIEEENVSGLWSRVDGTHFFPLRDHRVVFQPREWWCNIYPSGSIATHESKEAADSHADHHRVECIHVREVFDEDSQPTTD